MRQNWPNTVAKCINQEWPSELKRGDVYQTTISALHFVGFRKAKELNFGGNIHKSPSFHDITMVCLQNKLSQKLNFETAFQMERPLESCWKNTVGTESQNALVAAVNIA